MKGKLITFEELMDDIRDALCEAEGEEIARVYNKICFRPVSYFGDSLWEKEGE